jgi:serine/threonine-protein kinase
MVGALHGLHAAHEAKSDHGEPLGIVHRDVSPHNILVGTDGVARVLDFGVAKAVGRLQTTREGQLKGKLAYMAPEQVRGEVSRRTDVYAAAVVLWEALAGKRLFAGENEAQVIDRVIRGCDVPPSQHTPGLRRSLDLVTMRGLRVDPAERFETARDMARALEDAIPLATASRIGDWVEAMAKETLEERSARIAGIESDSTPQAQKPRTRGTSMTSEELLATVGSPASSLPAEATSDVGGEEVLFTQLATGLGSSGSTSLPTPNRRRTWLVATAVTLFAAMAIVAVYARRSSAPSPAASATLPVPSHDEAPPPAASASAPPAQVEAVSSAAASASVAAPVASNAPSPTAPGRHTAPRPTPSTPCKLVKVLDKNGEPHFSCPCARCS